MFLNLTLSKRFEVNFWLKIISVELKKTKQKKKNKLNSKLDVCISYKLSSLIFQSFNLRIGKEERFNSLRYFDSIHTWSVNNCLRVKQNRDLN